MGQSLIAVTIIITILMRCVLTLHDHIANAGRVATQTLDV